MSLIERTQPAESQIPTVSHHGEIPSGQPVCEITLDGKVITAVVGESILRTTMSEFAGDYAAHITDHRCPTGTCAPARSRRYETMAQP